VKSSFAIGQPPKPCMAPSNLLQPDLKAASIFSNQAFGVVCKCAPNSMWGYSGIKLVNKYEIISGVDDPTVSLSERILTPIVASLCVHSPTISTFQGSP